MVTSITLITQILDNIYRLQLPIPFPLQTMNVYYIDHSPRTLIDTGIKTEASFEALIKGLEALGKGDRERRDRPLFPADLVFLSDRIPFLTDVRVTIYDGF